MTGSGRTRINPVGESPPRALETITCDDHRSLPQEDWLPITESRKGNIYSCIFHLVSSGVGFQALLLPLAFLHLGWVWGIFTLCIAFAWSMYTTWLLVELHESPTGPRYSRYLQLSIAAFGPKLGKLFVLFPVLYLSGGTCVMLIITGGGTMKLLHALICDYNGHRCDPNALSAFEWFLIFIFLAILISQFLPNLNSVAWVSLIGSLVALTYCSLVWILPVTKGRPSGVSYSPPTASQGDRIMNSLSALGIIALSLRGHNVVLEIQGTLPRNLKFETKAIMWKGVKVSYVFVFLCVFPLAICGFWAYGTLIPSGGMLNAFAQFHNHGNTRALLGMLYFLLIINSLCTFQIYAMPAFDNLELRATSMLGKRCSWWQRAALRVCFGGITLFIAVTFPFLPKLAALVGGVALPLTFVYPCFMWIALKKARVCSLMWWFNLSLGCLGVGVALLVVASAIWNLVNNHFHANFFHPK